MQAIKFVHRVSKGSRFNQIYVPKEYEQAFHVGDIVQVMLLEKKTKLYYSKNLRKLSEFKEKLIKDIFSQLSKFKEIKQVFIFGSFLTKKADYNDIDIFLISDNEDIDKQVHENLTDKFNMKFHVIALNEENLKHQLKISPMIRSMFYYFVSNKTFSIPKDREVDINHIKYLLMFPEDLLEVSLDEGKVYYDTLRKLFAIEYFLRNEDIAPDLIDSELEKLIDKKKLDFIKENRALDKNLLKEINTIMKDKIKLIYKLLKNVKKR